jgi:hypothetical protein
MNTVSICFNSLFYTGRLGHKFLPRAPAPTDAPP